MFHKSGTHSWLITERESDKETHFGHTKTFSRRKTRVERHVIDTETVRLRLERRPVPDHGEGTLAGCKGTFETAADREQQAGPLERGQEVSGRSPRSVTLHFLPGTPQNLDNDATISKIQAPVHSGRAAYGPHQGSSREPSVLTQQGRKYWS